MQQKEKELKLKMEGDLAQREQGDLVQKNEALFALEFLRLKEKLKSFPTGTISRKHRKSGDEYYWQFADQGKRKEKYIRKADVPQVLAQLEERKRVKKRLRDLKNQLRAMPAPQKRRYRAAIALAQEWDILHTLEHEKQVERDEAMLPNGMHPPAEIFMNGVHTRSRAEQMCLNLSALFDLKVQYEPPFQTFERHVRGAPPYIADFLITTPSGKHFYWEHLGRLDDPEYKRHQRRKLKEYRREGYIRGKNLIVTTSGSHVNEQRILWELIFAGALDPCVVRRKMHRLAKQITKWQG